MVTLLPNPYSLTRHDGKVVDEITHQALLAVEKILGYELTITQGSYNPVRSGGGVPASGGTHDGGGVVDLAPFDAENKVRALRKVGFAAWFRPPIPGLWGAHVHAVLIGNEKLSEAAKRQVTAYANHRDGLKSNLPDTFPFHPDGVIFKMPKIIWRRPSWAKSRKAEIVAYHNIFVGLNRFEAREALESVLEANPDLVGLGEWGPNRMGILAREDEYEWVKPGASYPPIGAKKSRYRKVSSRGVTLAEGRPVDKKPGKPSRGFLPDNHATVVVWEEIETGHIVTTVCFHLPSGTEAHGAWRRLAGSLTRRARMAREAKRKLRKIARNQWSRGRRVYIMGDTNFDQMKLLPLISCWKGRTARSTHGSRTIDEIYAQRRATRAITLRTHSDHKAVIASYLP